MVLACSPSDGERPSQKDHLSLGIWVLSEQHSETLLLTKKMAKNSELAH
jgi:hypothetical protein